MYLLIVNSQFMRVNCLLTSRTIGDILFLLRNIQKSVKACKITQNTHVIPSLDLIKNQLKIVFTRDGQ